ncbi:MAG: pyridoxamine 5'-phosphate oxidase family protein [Pseudomonadota bacterium]
MGKTQWVTDVAALEACVGRKNPALDLKVIDHLDDLARDWLNCATLGFATLAGTGTLSATLVNAAELSATRERLMLPLGAWESAVEIQPDTRVGTLWLIPGVRESLRINGKVVQVDGTGVQIDVDECFGHCGKALIRSDFWQAQTTDHVAADLAELVGDARFLALATVSANGAADLSPKGDPAGLLLKLIEDELYLAERPGNRRTDSLRNLLQNPSAALLLLTPGSVGVARIHARARITAQPSLCEALSVDGKTPKLVIHLADPKVELFPSRILQAAAPWPAAPAPAHIEPARIFATHIRLNKARGLSAKLTQTMVAVPGLMDKALESDYKKNLY